MTPNENKLAAELLRLASDQFANHGCNDFPLAPLIPSQEARDELVRAWHEWNGDPEEYYEADAPDYRLMDYALMDYLADLLDPDPLHFGGV
jgi:hypothetical protein